MERLWGKYGGCTVLETTAESQWHGCMGALSCPLSGLQHPNANHGATCCRVVVVRVAKSGTQSKTEYGYWLPNTSCTGGLIKPHCYPLSGMLFACLVVHDNFPESCITASVFSLLLCLTEQSRETLWMNFLFTERLLALSFSQINEAITIWP